MTEAQVAGVVVLVALGCVVGSLGWLHLVPTGLSPVSHAVSQYGITRFRAGYRVATLAFAAAAAALAVGVASTPSSHREAQVVVALGVFASARAAISWFPMDTPNATRTATGRHHGLLAFAAFLAMTFAAYRMGQALADDAGAWTSLAGTSRGLAVAMAVCLLGLLVSRGSPALHRYFGLIERAFYVAAIAWVAVFGVACVVQ